MSRLDGVDLTASLSKKEGSQRLERVQERLRQLRLTLGGQIGERRLGPGVLILFEGWDASGKGGAIKRLVAPLDPRHVRVCQFAVPTSDEARHHFLWRFWGYVPGRGGMAVFDRSWYGRVLVERVEALAGHDEWTRAFGEINEFERSLTNEGTVLVKLWLHLSSEEQLKRFRARENDPLKAWKLTDDDWRNRDKRPAYERAIEEMLERTDKRHARWELVPAESKPYARVHVVETVIARIEQGMLASGMEPPKPLE